MVKLKGGNEMNAMSEDNKYEKYDQPQPEKRAAVDIQELNITGTPLRSIFFKNNNSSVIVIIAGILLIMLRKPASIVLGIFCIALALFVWFKVGDAKVIDIYRDFLIIYSDKDPNKAIKVNMDEIEEWAIKNNVSVYDEILHRGLLRHLYVRIAEVTGEIMVCLVINGKSVPNKNELTDKLKAVSGFKSLQLNVNTQKTNVILGKECIKLYGSDYITDVLCGLKFNISPLSFYQVNRTQAERLYSIPNLELPSSFLHEVQDATNNTVSVARTNVINLRIMYISF